MRNTMRSMAVLSCTFIVAALACVGVANADVASDACLRAVKVLNLKGSASFICFDGIANVSASVGGFKRTFVVDESSREYRDTTGKSKHEAQALISEIKKGERSRLDYGKYVDSPYRGRLESTARRSVESQCGSLLYFFGR